MGNKGMLEIATATPIDRPKRKMIILRSKAANDYFTFCERMGCNWEGMLNSVPEKFDDAALITLPEQWIMADTSATAAGIEVPINYEKPIPETFDIIKLSPCRTLYFQGMPFENEDDFGKAINIVFKAIDNYKPELYGYKSDWEAGPKFNFVAQAIVHKRKRSTKGGAPHIFRACYAVLIVETRSPKTP